MNNIEIITLILAIAGLLSILLVEGLGVGHHLCAYCGCREATGSLDGLAICDECRKAVEH